MMTNCAAVPVCDLALGIAIWKAAGGGGWGCVCVNNTVLILLLLACYRHLHDRHLENFYSSLSKNS